MTMIDVCDLTDLTADGVTIRYREQRHIDAVQAMARQARRVFTQHGDYGVPGMADRIERFESAVDELSVVSETRWTTAEIHNVCGALNSILHLVTIRPSIRLVFVVGDAHAIDVDVLSEAAEPLNEAMMLMAAMRLAQAGGAS